MGKKRRADGEGSIFYSKSHQCWIAQIRVRGPSKSRGHTKYRTKHAKTLREASRALQALKAKYRTVSAADADTILVGEWLQIWFETFSRPRIRANTARSYRYILNIAIEEVGDIRLCRLTDIDLQKVIYGRLHDHYRTAKFFRTIIKSALRRAVRSKMLQESPAENLELPKKPPAKPYILPSQDDWRSLILYDKSTYAGWRWILMTEYVTGARLSEILGMQWTDFDFIRDKSGRLTGGTLHIQHALIVSPEGISLQPTKTERSDRILQLPADYCQEMMMYQMSQGRKTSGYVFTREDGRPINPSSFSSHFSHVRKNLHLDTTFHMLRHDMATRMKESDRFDLKDIQTQLGHSSIRITMDTYTHMTDARCRSVSDWLGDGIKSLLRV